MIDHGYLRYMLAKKIAKKHLFEGEWLTAKEIADRTGLSVSTIYERLRKGYPVNAPKMRGGTKAKLYEFRGEHLTIREAARVLGVHEETARSRAIGGRIMEDHELRQHKARQHNSEIITYAGISDTVSGWSRRTGLSIATIFHRLFYRGWTVKRALTEPPGNSSPCTVRRVRNAGIIRQLSNRFRISRIASAFSAGRTTAGPATTIATGGYRKTFHDQPGTGVGRHPRDLQSEKLTG